ncbi:MAG: D-alanine--D-alanine ligase [Flavobacteriaceae bacterium]|nr:D-alanine--D-alanine ligase [Flavobacteriaceae bacterium]
MKKNIAIVMGGFSSESEISLKSGSVVMEHLNGDHFQTHKVVIAQNEWTYIDNDGKLFAIDKNDFSVLLPSGKLTFDAVFNAIHGAPGENGQLQSYFDLVGMPYTGCSSYASALTFNKRDCIAALKPFDIPAATSYYLNQGDTIDVTAILDTVGLPCFVKANCSGSSFGVTKVYKSSDMTAAIEVAFKEGSEVLIESFLDGIEVSVGVIRYQDEVLVLPATEIVSENDFFDYEAKYLGKSEEITPARLTPLQLTNLNTLAKKVYESLQMEGFSRSEFIFVGDIPHFIEINTIPGLTNESLLPQQAKIAGISLKKLFEDMAKQAIIKK